MLSAEIVLLQTKIEDLEQQREEDNEKLKSKMIEINDMKEFIDECEQHITDLESELLKSNNNLI